MTEMLEKEVRELIAVALRVVANSAKGSARDNICVSDVEYAADEQAYGNPPEGA